MKPEEKAFYLKQITQVVRALIVSTKPPVSLDDIERDYRATEGEGLPYLRLGYRTTRDLLEDTKAFVIKRTHKGYIISAHYNRKTAHIASMVLKQKPGKPKFKAARPQAPCYDNNYSHSQESNEEPTWRVSMFRLRCEMEQKLEYLYRQNQEQQRRENIMYQQQQDLLRDLRQLSMVVQEQQQMLEGMWQPEIRQPYKKQRYM
ncbi:tudor domain-containing protein 5 [Drosophila busckii]|uniref:tudor domain-containing protein 5 n=1 Tax=Drosophila busckii TaxID=30019 RepID=UPI00083E9F1B|nr:tudor domain-containing protein 5 [Drosophila busckii]